MLRCYIYYIKSVHHRSASTGPHHYGGCWCFGGTNAHAISNHHADSIATRIMLPRDIYKVTAIE